MLDFVKFDIQEIFYISLLGNLNLEFSKKYKAAGSIRLWPPLGTKLPPTNDINDDA